MEANEILPDQVPIFKNGHAPGPASIPDPFDPAHLRIRSDNGGIAVKKLITNIPVSKPNKQAFVRVHPDEAYRVTTAVIDLKEDGKAYLVMPHLHEALAGESSIVTLFTAVDRNGSLFLWMDGFCRREPLETIILGSVTLINERTNGSWARKR